MIKFNWVTSLTGIEFTIYTDNRTESMDKAVDFIDDYYKIEDMEDYIHATWSTVYNQGTIFEESYWDMKGHMWG